MFTGIQAVIAFVVLVVAITAVISAIAWFRLRGRRVITCPESKTVEVVEVDAVKGALQDMFRDRPALNLSSCSRWPERQDCGQECLTQIEGSRDGCLLVSMLAQWYEGKSCAYCNRPFKDISWHEHRPGLRSPKGDLVEWSDFPPQTVFDVLSDHEPVCWDCLVAESFRERYPDLVTDRKWDRDAGGEYHGKRQAS